jgi:hypothetical protein
MRQHLYAAGPGGRVLTSGALLMRQDDGSEWTYERPVTATHVMVSRRKSAGTRVFTTKPASDFGVRVYASTAATVKGV